MAKKDNPFLDPNAFVDGDSEEINDKVNVKNKNNVDDSLENAVNGKKSKVKTHKLKGIYFEPEVAAAIDKLAKGKSKGVKSDIVNEAVKQVFKQKGWM